MAGGEPSWLLHLDVDAFFAALEQRDDRRLRGRPVAVGTGVVASCSYEARPWGVRTAMRLSDARRLCPTLIVLPGDYRRYEIASRQITGICQEYTPRVELAALDDVYLDLGRAALEEAAGMARRIAEQVRAEVGLAVSLGLGTNRLVGAVATQAVKERKARQGEGGREADLQVVSPGTERQWLAPWPVSVLPGVGPKTSAELARLNVRRVGELAEVPAEVLMALFGSRGKVLRDLAHGIDPRPVEPHRPALSVGRCTSFDPPVGELPFLAAMLDHLLERAVSWLRTNTQAARGLTVRIRYADHQSVDSRVVLPRPCDDEAELSPLARQRLARLYVRRLPLRLLGVELSPLGAPASQGELFRDEAKERQRRLRQCKDEVRQRFGFMALVKGSALELVDRLEHDRDNFKLRTPCLTR